LLAAGLASAQQLPDYRLHPGDSVEIGVWKETELQKIAIIRPDGKFSFPLVGEITAVGRTVTEIHKEIVDHLREFIPEPVVTVSVKEVDGNRVYVIGQVAKPGAVAMNPAINVLQALAIAGGLTPFAAANDIIVIRKAGNEQQVLHFRYGEVAKGSGLQQNINLVAGDVVIVP